MLVGACMNWHSLLTAKEISRWVMVQYCKALIILLYRAMFEREVSSLIKSTNPKAIGVAQVLNQPFKL